jgi:hypothetical protein
MRVLVAIAVVLGLTGCAALPVSGPVRIGPDLTQSTQTESFYYSPSSPIDGASQAEILNGFIAAGTGPQNDYAVAREYLSESIRSSWNPSQEVIIQRASPNVTIGDNNTAQLEIDVSARIDVDGKYESLPQGSSRIIDFAFVSENGQWRLSKVPDATVLIRPVFEVVFRGYSVYFLDRQKRYLVPELRWFPATAATGTKLANALLKGPSAWLRPAVLSAIPSGTRLSIDAVTVEDGVALVDLTARALVATGIDRQLMKAQLDATLSQLANVERVALSIERSRQEITETSLDLRATGSKSLVVLGATGLEAVATADTGFFESAQEFFELNPTELFTLSKATSSLALVTPAGVIRTSSSDPGAQLQLVDARSGIVAVDYDLQNYLWKLARARGSEVFATNPEGERTRVLAPWLGQEAVRGFALSPEGSRAVVVVQGVDRNRVLLTSVIRNQAGVPIELASPIEIASDISNPTQVSWVNKLTVAVVNLTPDFTNAYLVDIGGTARVISAVSGTRSIVAAGPAAQLYLLTNSGELYSFRGSTWSLVRAEVFALTIVD